MSDPTTANKILAQPTRGSDTGTWDTPMNNNTGIIDASFGGITTIALTNASVILSTAQAQNVFIKLTGALTATVNLTFPGGIGSFYTIINQTTNSSNFAVTMTTSAAGSNQIGLPPGQLTKVLIDGTSPQYEALPLVGSYWHFAGQSAPSWLSQCTVPPFINCDGTTFSSATYPALTAFLGGTTLPDSRGRSMFALDQGTGRNGTSFLSGGGNANITLTTGQLPTFTPSGTIGGSQTFSNVLTSAGGQNVGSAAAPAVNVPGSITVNGSNFTFTGNSIGSGNSINIMDPYFVGGLIFIRAG